VFTTTLRFILAGAAVAATAIPASAAVTGYYRHPDLHGDTFVFTAEGDLWTATLSDPVARRLTAHPGEELHPHLSPDGSHVAYTASYDGTSAVYVMPLVGGEPRRLTYSAEGVRVVGWTPDGDVLYASRQTTTLPGRHLHRVDPDTRVVSVYPLENADHGAVHPDTGELVFTRYRFQGSHTRQYQGGTAQTLWRWREEGEEARPLPDDHPGTAREPMWWGDRILFVTDRGGSFDLWSMTLDGDDLRPHTDHAGWDVRWPSRSGDRVLYTLGADLILTDLATGEDRRLDVTLLSDVDQRRERWIDEPLDYLTDAELSPDGERVALTARGEVFVIPTGRGRIVEASRASGVRYRRARFAPMGDSLHVFSDASGEIELWTLPANGIGGGRQVTADGKVLRYDHLASPDGRRVAHHDKDHELHVTDLETGATTLVARSEVSSFGGLAWSPDGRWLAAVVPATNWNTRIWLHDTETGSSEVVTGDRWSS